MPTRRPNRPAPDTIAVDRAALMTLQSLPEYTPSSPDLSVERLVALESNLSRTEQAERLARLAWEQARAEAAAATVEFHDSMCRVRALVRAHFGSDSPALKAVGLKQRSERKRPAPRSLKLTQ